MKIVCLGDSLTFGYGVQKRDRWTEILKSRLSVQVINKGINGDSTAGMLSRSYKDIVNNSPTHAIIMGGTNDFIGSRGIDIVLDNICEILEECMTNNIKPIAAIQPPIIVEMAQIYWAKGINYGLVNNHIEKYRERMLQYSINKNILCADFYKTIKLLLKENNNELFLDGIHTSSKGHQIMADLISSLLTEDLMK